MSYRHAFRALLPLFLALPCTPLIAQIPSNPLIELRAESGVTVEDGVVTRWADLSPNGYDATPPLAGPRLVPVSEEHGHPTVAFDGSNFLKFPDVFPVASDYTKVTVVRI